MTITSARTASCGPRHSTNTTSGSSCSANFATFRLAYDLYLGSSLATVGSLSEHKARWTVDPALIDAWGRRGLEIAGRNLDEIVALCRQWDWRMTLVVNPRPTMTRRAIATASR
jgi:hypothetical protein